MLEHLDQYLQQLQLYCRHHSNHLLAGHYHSAFKGQGIEFDEVRQYALGDDIRAIDWNVTARTGDLYIKRFHEERELNLIFVLDKSPSFFSSSSNNARPLMAAKFCALLGNAAITNNDRIGFLSFSDTLTDYMPPARGRSQLMRGLSKFLQASEHAKYTSIASALNHLSHLSLKRSIIVLISDFFSQNDCAKEQGHYHEALAILSQQHEVLAIAIDDTNERHLPACSLMTLSDVETGQQQLVDLADSNVRLRFASQMQHRLKERSEHFSQIGVDLLSHPLNADPVNTLLQFFHHRSARIQGETGG